MTRVVKMKASTLYQSYVFAELSIDHRVDSAKTTNVERQLCGDDVASAAAEDEGVSTAAVNHNGSVHVESSPYKIDSSQHKPESPPVSAASTSTPVSTDSVMRHSASDSLVYRADVTLASTHDVDPDCLQGDQVAHSARLNGYCKAVEETQVCHFLFRGNYHFIRRPRLSFADEQVITEQTCRVIPSL